MAERVALVTGGTRGIGATISTALNKAGYKVAANYGGNEEAAKKFTMETMIPAFKWDVGNFAACQEGVKRVSQALGGPVEILVNNAGITRDGTMHKMTFEQWNAVIQTNLTSCFNMCRVVIDNMREKSFGRIVNIGSINGQAGQYGQVNYAAAKSGIHGFTKALAQEGASKNITVNAIAPGFFDTELNAPLKANKEFYEGTSKRTPMGRWAQPEELGGAVVFLASPGASYVTGHTLVVDGGLTAAMM